MATPKLAERQEMSGQFARHAYLPYVNLVYLIFLFFPLFFSGQLSKLSLILSLVSLVVFLPLHFLFYRAPTRYGTYIACAMAALCFSVTPYNAGANTYLIYAVICAAYCMSIRSALAFLIICLILLGLEVYWLDYSIAFFVATLIMACALVVYAIYSRKIEQHNQQLQLSQQEVQRMARSAERERIGRDLHDVLGHTMSLIVMKSELASKLFDRNPNAAINEIREVERIARDALGQIRLAVSGIRLAGLEAELANARLSLLSADIQLHYQLVPFELAPELETVLALGVREAVTNIIRHAKAQRVEIELTCAKGMLQLQISDDGRGGLIVPGNGLSGMRERLEAVGGQLTIDTGLHGIRLALTCPMSAKSNEPLSAPFQQTSEV